MSKRSASNGGEGGIRTPGTLSGTTDFESVTFGHSATSPKKLGKKVRTLSFGKPRLLNPNDTTTVSVAACVAPEREISSGPSPAAFALYAPSRGHSH